LQQSPNCQYNYSIVFIVQVVEWKKGIIIFIDRLFLSLMIWANISILHKLICIRIQRFRTIFIFKWDWSIYFLLLVHDMIDKNLFCKLNNQNTQISKNEIYFIPCYTRICDSRVLPPLHLLCVCNISLFSYLLSLILIF